MKTTPCPTCGETRRRRLSQPDNALQATLFAGVSAVAALWAPWFHWFTAAFMVLAIVSLIGLRSACAKCGADVKAKRTSVPKSVRGHVSSSLTLHRDIQPKSTRGHVSSSLTLHRDIQA